MSSSTFRLDKFTVNCDRQGVGAITSLGLRKDGSAIWRRDYVEVYWKGSRIVRA